MRGTVGSEWCMISYPGITPAHAGNSEGFVQGVIDGEDHPRACGEQRVIRAALQPARGSPPRMRGTGRLGTIFFALIGITPAHAGNSGRRGRADAVNRDHPRACGEQAFVLLRSKNQLGSPPRMRGTAGGDRGHRRG